MTDEPPERLQSSRKGYHDDPDHYSDASLKEAHGAMNAALAGWDATASGDVPDWAQTTLSTWRAGLHELLDLTHAAPHAMSIMPEMPFILEAIHASQGPGDEGQAAHRASELSDVVETAMKSVKLVETEFRLLYVLGSVWLWASLEALVEDLVLVALFHTPKEDLALRVRGLKLAGDVAVGGDLQRLYQAIYREWETKQAAGAAGATQFESVLSLAGLDGQVPGPVRRAVFELGHVRNLLLHRGGVVDAEFIAACPWLGIPAGSHVMVNHHLFEEYAFAVMHYVALLRTRLAAAFGRSAAE